MELAVQHKLDITSNMEELAKNIKKDIKEKFDVIVTEDRLPETKKLMAQVNKDKKDFTDKWKSFKEKMLEPLIPLDEKAKEIESEFDSARAALDNQVKNFEKGKLEAIRVIVEKYRDDACLTANITTESIIVTDLVILTAVSTNSKGYTIAKGTSDKIDQRIQAIELQIAKARIEEEEKAKRDREIAENARREAEDRARVREAELLAKAERDKIDALVKAEREKEEAVAKATRVDIAPVQQPVLQEEAKEPTFTDDGRKSYSIAFIFGANANPNVPINKVIEKVKSMMLSEIGLEKLKSIEVR